jgi:hypothetical protein
MLLEKYIEQFLQQLLQFKVSRYDLYPPPVVVPGLSHHSCFVLNTFIETTETSSTREKTSTSSTSAGTSSSTSAGTSSSASAGTSSSANSGAGNAKPRIKWTDRQNKLLWSHFIHNLLERVPVRQDEAEAFLNSERALGLINCTWKQLKNKIWNDCNSKTVVKKLTDVATPMNI